MVCIHVATCKPGVSGVGADALAELPLRPCIHELVFDIRLGVTLSFAFDLTRAASAEAVTALALRAHTEAVAARHDVAGHFHPTLRLLILGRVPLSRHAKHSLLVGLRPSQ